MQVLGKVEVMVAYSSQQAKLFVHVVKGAGTSLLAETGCRPFDQSGSPFSQWRRAPWQEC